MAKLSCYSFVFSPTVVAGGIFLTTFEILNVNREMQLKSILLTVLIYDPVSNTITPWEQNTKNLLIFRLNDGNSQISDTFSNFSVSPIHSGNYLYFNNPGQYFFETFFIKNKLPLLLSVQNFTPTSQQYRITGVIETIEKIIYQ